MKKVSICGKGGGGKSVVISLIASILVEEGYTVLAIDSDESNPGLYRMLGFENPPRSIVDVDRSQAYLAPEFEEKHIRISDIPSEYLAEKGTLKLVVIGKIQQALEGCACVMGNIVRDLLSKLIVEDKEIVLVDTEAGVEHLGIGLEEYVDTVLLLVEPSFESLALAEKAYGMVAKMDSAIQIWAVLNKITSPEIENDLREKLVKRNIKVAGVIHYDPQLYHDCWIGKPLGDSQAKQEAREIANFLLGKPGTNKVSPRRSSQ